jgi:hypothetical protein
MPLDLAPRARRRLVVPAPRHDARETILAARPFFLRGAAAPVAAAPPLLSFPDADFMDDFLAATGDASLLPKLLAWRDWAEPPSGVLDAAGRALYPASLARAEPYAIEPEDDVGTDGVPAGTPPWLRKLYLPLHLRFTIVAFDLVCRRLGFPPVDRARVVASGAVVRRLRLNREEIEWEDWISADGKRGIWTRLALPIGQLDPAAIADAAYAGQEVTLRARLGLAAAAPLPKALDSAKLALLQPDAAGGQAAKHTTVYGYLPVFSSAEQAPDSAPASPAAIVAALQARATETMQAAADAIPAMADRLRDALGDLLAETILPEEPTLAEYEDAWDVAVAYAASAFTRPSGISDAAAAIALATAPSPRPSGPLDEDVALTLDTALVGMFAAGFVALAPSSVDGDAIDPDAPETAGMWLGRARDLMVSAAAAEPSLRAALFGSNWGADNFADNRPSWRILLDYRLHRWVTALLGGTPIPPPRPGVASQVAADGAALLFTDALLRLRVLRLALAASLRTQMFGPGADTTSLTDIAPEGPVSTPGSLGTEIAAALALEAWRGTEQEPSWPPLDTATPTTGSDRRAFRAHDAAMRLEAIYAEFESAVAPAGTAFDEEQTARLDDRAGTIAARLTTLTDTATDAASLRAQGLEIREQPARGILGIPGFAPTSFAIASLGIPLAARYADQAYALRVSRDEARVQRLRYDSDSLYAVWCFARIAGRDACEKEQVVWTLGSEPFSIAEPTDLLGARPATVQLPDINRLIRDIPRIAKAKAKPFAAFAAPPNSSYITGEEAEDTKRAWGIGWICSFAIPVLTICAWILFSIIFSILIILPSFTWMLFLKFCIPIPVPKKPS